MEGYEMIKELGHGSFGRVWRAKRKADGQIVAIKEIDYGTMGKQEKQLLVNEVNVLKKLHNPHIVRYVDRSVNRERRKMYIVMEYCAGGDLQSMITATRASCTYIAEDQIWLTLTELAMALNDCHNEKEKILHRDIKPANIFIDSEGHVKLGDFGLARNLTTDFARTRVGTPYYMSPELVSGRGYDDKSDIWALGCVIYEMANLRPAFRTACSSEEELYRKIRTATVARIPSRYSDALWKCVESMLDKDPRKRPTAAELLKIHNVEITMRLSEAKEKLASIRARRANLSEKMEILAQKEQKLRALEKRVKDENVHANVA